MRKSVLAPQANTRPSPVSIPRLCRRRDTANIASHRVPSRSAEFSSAPGAKLDAVPHPSQLRRDEGTAAYRPGIEIHNPAKRAFAPVRSPSFSTTGGIPRRWAAEEITRFVTALAVERQVSASTQNQALAALLFLYREVLGRDPGWLGAATARAARQRAVPYGGVGRSCGAVRGRWGQAPRLQLLPQIAIVPSVRVVSARSGSPPSRHCCCRCRTSTSSFPCRTPSMPWSA